MVSQSNVILFNSPLVKNGYFARSVPRTWVFSLIPPLLISLYNYFIPRHLICPSNYHVWKLFISRERRGGGGGGKFCKAFIFSVCRQIVSPQTYSPFLKLWWPISGPSHFLVKLFCLRNFLVWKWAKFCNCRRKTFQSYNGTDQSGPCYQNTILFFTDFF